MSIHRHLPSYRRLTYLLPAFFLLSCQHFYKISASGAGQTRIDSVLKANLQRYFILREAQHAFAMNRVVLSEDHQSLTCVLDSLPDEHQLHSLQGPRQKMHYKKNSPEVEVLNELHVFVPDDASATPGTPYRLDLSKVQRLELIVKDNGRTARSYVFGSVGITVAVATVGLLIFAAADPLSWGGANP